jgi:MOSC domain-containing protein YiiM
MEAPYSARGYTQAGVRILSVNVSQPREVRDLGGRIVQTSIFKTPISDSAVRVRATNVDGDRQSDLVKHGGPLRAVYMYPSEHYDFWQTELPGTDLPWGAFGENLTSEGLLEGDVRVGDRLRIGTAELVVTRPRKPCYKLAIRLACRDIVPRFKSSGRSGFYLSVAREGELRAGDHIELIERGAGQTIRALVEDATVMATHYKLPRPADDEFGRHLDVYVDRVAPFDDAVKALEDQRDCVVARLRGVSVEKASFRYAPGKWSAVEVVGHLADTERVFGYRLMRFGRNDQAPLSGFDENTYVPAGAFDRRPIADVVDEFAAVRNATVALVKGMPSEAWTRRGMANNKEISTRALVYVVLGHVEHHLALLAERYHVGP